jgi:hypothetical protein
MLAAAREAEKAKAAENRGLFAQQIREITQREKPGQKV